MAAPSSLGSFVLLAPAVECVVPTPAPGVINKGGLLSIQRGGVIKTYLAARYSKKYLLRGYAAELRALGLDVISSWLNEPHDLNIEMPELQREEAEEFAATDLREVSECDLFIIFTEDPLTAFKRGGRHVETGAALALGKTVFTVGPVENIFHTLATRNFGTWAELVGTLGKVVKEGGDV